MSLELSREPEKVNGTENIYMVGYGQFGLIPGTAYLINSDSKVLIETGTSLNVPKIMEDLSDLGVESLDYIAVTHIHMDHTGGAGLLIDEFPKAQVIVHKSGAKHLVDPSRLKESVRGILGDFFEYYGDIRPVPEDRIESVSGGEEFDLGVGQILKVIHTPGHASHHVCFYEPGSRSLAVGDIAGIYYPERDELFPTTPPPDFHLEKNIEVLRDLRKLDLSLLLYTHFGWTDEPQKKLEDYIWKLKNWVSEIGELRSELDDEGVKRAIKERYSHPIAVMESRTEIAEFELDMYVQGILLYLDRASESRR